MKLIFIQWIDATSKLNWMDNDGDIDGWIDEKGIMTSCGIYIKETDDFVCLATTHSEETDYSNEAYCNLLKIPKKWIKKRKFIKV